VPARSGLGVFSVRPVAGRFVILQVSEMLRLEMPLRDVQKTLEFIGNRGVSGVFQWIEEMHHSRPSADGMERSCFYMQIACFPNENASFSVLGWRHRVPWQFPGKWRLLGLPGPC